MNRTARRASRSSSEPGNVTTPIRGRHVELTIEAESEEAAQAQVQEMAARLLSNPVIEEFQVLRAEQVGR